MEEAEKQEEPFDWEEQARAWQGMYYDVMALAKRMQETNKSILKWAWMFFGLAISFWAIMMFLAYKMDQLEDYKDRCESSCQVAEVEVRDAE